MPHHEPLAPSALRAWLAFLTAAHLIEHQVEHQLKRDGGISHAEFEILLHLHEAPDRRLRMSELARNAMISKSRLTYQVTRLEEAGFVKRTACPTDRRAVWAQLTDEGAEALARVRPGHRQTVRECLIDQLSPAEIEQLGDALGRVAETLRART